MSAEPQMTQEQLEQLLKMFPQLRTMLQGGVAEPKPSSPLDDLTVADLVDRYLARCLAENVHAASTRPAKLKNFEDFKRVYGHLLPATLKPFHLSDWVASHPAWKSTATRRARSAEIKAVFGWAALQGRISRNPFSVIHYESGEPRPCTNEVALNAIIGIASPRAAAALRFLRLTGARVGETCELTWSGVDLVRGLATFERHKTRKKTRKPKVIALTAECVELLRTLGPRGPGDRVFTTMRGGRWTPCTLYIAFRDCRLRLGLPLSIGSIHGIRHLWATEAIKNGVPIKYVAQMLGHSSVLITEQFYVSIANDFEGLRRAAELATGNKAPQPDSVPVDLSAPPMPASPATSKEDTARPLEILRAPVPDGNKVDDRPTEPTDGQERQVTDLSPVYATAYAAMQWAIERRPELAEATDECLHTWLMQQPEWAKQLPPRFQTFQGYLYYARVFFGLKKQRATARIRRSFEAAYLAMLWAKEQRPEFARPTYGSRTLKRMHAWLRDQPEWKDQLPPSWVTFRRYLGYARLHYDCGDKKAQRRAGFVEPDGGDRRGNGKDGA